MFLEWLVILWRPALTPKQQRDLYYAGQVPRYTVTAPVDRRKQWKVIEIRKRA